MAALPTFQVGETVVHPQRGVGQISRLEEREFVPGVTRLYYEMTIPGGLIVWVPADLPNAGLRHVAEASDLNDCRQILASSPQPLDIDKRARQSELAAHLKLGTLRSQCEVVRDLSAHVAHKPTSGSIAAFLQVTETVLYQEWSLIEGVSVPEAGEEIRTLLLKGRQETTE